MGRRKKDIDEEALDKILDIWKDEIKFETKNNPNVLSKEAFLIAVRKNYQDFVQKHYR